ncbi:D-aminoacyl-tRNA deacylase [bacterium HR35]|nr:D-aminoacyl-tRNA deacylase [bacterium HR35]
MLFDTHAHLNLPHFEKNLEKIIEEAKKNQVNYILVPGINYQTSVKALEISKKFENIYSACGFHPSEIEDFDLEKIKKLLKEEKILAVGEIGIDKLKANNLEKQKFVFEEQVKLALEFNKPIIIHNRKGTDEILEILSKYQNEIKEKVIFHCTEPEEKILNFAIEYRCFLGFDGDLTYLEEKQNFVKKVPLNLILLETDSPFLVPEPLKSQKIFPNKPSNLPLILNFLSQLLKIENKTLEKIIFENSLRAFKILKNGN